MQGWRGAAFKNGAFRLKQRGGKMGDYVAWEQALEVKWFN